MSVHTTSTRQRGGGAWERRRKQPTAGSDGRESAEERDDPNDKEKKQNQVWLLVACVFASYFFFRLFFKWGTKTLEKNIEKYVEKSQRHIYKADHNNNYMPRALAEGYFRKPSADRKQNTNKQNKRASDDNPVEMMRQQRHLHSSRQQTKQSDTVSSLLANFQQKLVHKKNPSADVVAQQQQQKQKQSSPLRELPARVCVSKKDSLTDFSSKTPRKCHVDLCPPQLSLPPPESQESHNNHNIIVSSPNHYGHGFVHRPDIIRNSHTSMMLPGQAGSGSGCAISHKYQFIYIHVLKSGGMTLKTFLKQGLCQGSTKMPCALGQDHLQIVGCHSAVVQYPHYFVWSFVRNPFGRMYSIYAMALDYRQRKKKDTTVMLPPFSFDEFVHAKGASHSLKNKKRRQHYKRRRLLGGGGGGRFANRHGNKREFAEAMWSKMAPSSSSSKCTARRSMTYMDAVHCQPQYYFLFNEQDCPVFDYLGHLETFATDLKTVVDMIDSPELTQHYQQWTLNSTAINNSGLHKEKSTSFGSKQKEAQHGGSLRLAYESASGEGDLQQVVAKEYAKDFELLGYDPTVIPE
ncbi:expressed unknown protein [Seminavis robusta]|uniref:Sulfotransferase n=1 Tax=Seminavis robusta TaxID=568900 RepID=A0A9N8E7G9_9STRA|nr:expressed unknown protein [Seminavis robusta]|eukprot:Sro765_g199160.1 n/a (575) ;mRNA; f:12761-14485